MQIKIFKKLSKTIKLNQNKTEALLKTQSPIFFSLTRVVPVWLLLTT